MDTVIAGAVACRTGFQPVPGQVGNLSYKRPRRNCRGIPSARREQTDRLTAMNHRLRLSKRGHSMRLIASALCLLLMLASPALGDDAADWPPPLKGAKDGTVTLKSEQFL